MFDIRDDDEFCACDHETLVRTCHTDEKDSHHHQQLVRLLVPPMPMPLWRNLFFRLRSCVWFVPIFYVIFLCSGEFVVSLVSCIAYYVLYMCRSVCASDRVEKPWHFRYAVANVTWIKEKSVRSAWIAYAVVLQLCQCSLRWNIIENRRFCSQFST